MNLLTSQITLGLVRTRRGLPGALELLDPAVTEADGLDEAEWIANTRLARAEVLWLQGDDAAAIADLARIRSMISPLEYVEDAQLSVWEQRLLGEARPCSPAPEPWATWLAGDHAAAAARWEALGCGRPAMWTPWLFFLVGEPVKVPESSHETVDTDPHCHVHPAAGITRPREEIRERAAGMSDPGDRQAE